MSRPVPRVMPFPTERGERRESLKVSAHEKLGEVLRILRTILKNYSPILHSELMSAASQLISLVNGECVGGDLVSACVRLDGVCASDENCYI